MRMIRLRCALNVADSSRRNMEADTIYARNAKPHAPMSQSSPSRGRDLLCFDYLTGLLWPVEPFSEMTTSSPDVGEALAEALKKGEEAGGSKEDAVKAALDCPCVQGLKESSCGEGFRNALTCFITAPEEERGSACAEQFVELHQCMVKHAEEFEEFTKELVENETKEGYLQASTN